MISARRSQIDLNSLTIYANCAAHRLFCFGWVTQTRQESTNQYLSANRYALFRKRVVFYNCSIFSRTRQTFYHTFIQIQELQFKTCKRFLALHHQLVSRSYAPCPYELQACEALMYVTKHTCNRTHAIRTLYWGNDETMSASLDFSSSPRYISDR